jgi:ribonucleoside-diphosphate reductase beta chain
MEKNLITESIVSSNINTIFNVDKTDYASPSLFLGEEPGLFDTVNKKYPNIWSLYKEMKSLQWDENEFDYSSCNTEFKTVPRATYEMMLLNLAYQWEADSVACRAISSIVSLYRPAPELWACWQEISSNEVVHSATYSEIVRTSFDNPSVILDWVLKIEQATNRLSNIANVMTEAYDRGHKFALGLVENDQETYNAIFMFTIAMLALERIQFMSSFAVTFAICDSGLFQPIGKAIQKIANDEYKVHVELDREILRNECKTERGRIALVQCNDKIKKLIDEVTQGELDWVDFLFSEGRELVGMSPELLKKWVLFNARPVYSRFEIKPLMDCPSKNPLKFMEGWLDISNIQPAPQEQDIADYKVNVVRRNDQEEDFSDFF